MSESTDWMNWLKDKGVDTAKLQADMTPDWKAFEIRLSPHIVAKFTARLNNGQPEIKDGRLK